MHLAKGLEVRAVAVMACDDEVIPLQKRIEEVGDDADLKEITRPSAICSTPPTRAPLIARDHAGEPGRGEGSAGEISACGAGLVQ
jgi:hypothetical protein